MMNKQLNKLSLRLFVALLLTMAAKFSCAKKERAQSGTDINRITVAGSGVLTGNDAAATIEIKSLAPAYKGGTVLNLVWTATATPSTNASFQTAMTLDGGETWALSGGLPIPVDPLDRVEHSIEINLPAGDYQSTIIRIGLFDDAGLRAIATSDSFIVDSTAPKLTSLTLNEGDSLTLTNYVRVSLAATDVARDGGQCELS